MRVFFIRIYNGDVGLWTFFPELETVKSNLPIKRKTNDIDT